MSIAGGRILNIHFYQEQSGSYFESDGLLYYFSDIHYAFDMKDQRITSVSYTHLTLPTKA